MPLIADVRQFAADARAYATAEVTFQKSRARVVAIGARKIAMFGVFAVVFVVFAIGGLTVGLLLALTPLVTAWGATAIVVGLWLLIALLCVRGAARAWKRMLMAITGQRDNSL